MRHWSIAVIAAGMALAAADASAQTTLRVGLQEDPDQLDPALGRSFVGRIVFAALCDKLVDIDPQLNFVPQLATEWSWSDDGKVLTMTLREGVVFHDGEPFDAEAVKYNIERYLNLPGSMRKSEISTVASVEAVDPMTVRLNLAQPFSPLLAALSDRAGMMVSPKAAEEAGENFAQNPVCSGPFRFVERVPQDRIVVERFDDYWNAEAIQLDRIVYLPIPDATVRLANLQSGDLDIIERVAATDLEAVRADPSLQLVTIPSLGYQGITINIGNTERSDNPLGRDPRVREALELALDRDVVNQVAFNGENLPGNQSVPPGSPYYIESLPSPARDVERARQLLTEAGHDRLAIELMVPNSTEPMRVAQILQSLAAEAGFDIEINATEFATALDRQTAGDFQAFLIGWSGRVDPDGNIHTFNHCEGALNDEKYCNEEVDRLLDAARTVSDPAERLDLYRQAAEIYLAERPHIYLWHPVWFWALSDRVEGFVPYPDGIIRPQGIRLAS